MGYRLSIGWAMGLALAAMAAPPWAPTAVRDWPVVATASAFTLAPNGSRRIGFTLPPDSPGRRVAVRFAAWLAADAAVGYSDVLALELNGEVMGLTLRGQPRLLNRPMQFSFAPGGSRTQVSGTPGVLGLIECQGSARWTLAAAPSVAALLASADYAPSVGPDVVETVLEISDLVYAASYNVLLVKHEGEALPLQVQHLEVCVEPTPSLPVESPELDRVYRELKEAYFGRAAVVREPLAGREWVYDMELIESNHSASDTLAELETLDDARRLVARHQANGYTAIMVSGLHMRYSHLPLWETRILPYMKLLSQAAHEAGVRLIEHYDVPIYYSGGYPFLLEADHLDWTQRDLRYGTPTRMYCINSPGFREHFFGWAQRVQRECGIDAYQIDEAYFFDQHYCGCEDCRRRFREDTGFDLPRAADAPEFGNDASGLWRLFLLWRQVSMQRFKRDFIAAVRRENPAALLSDYTSTFHMANETGGLWPLAFVSYATGTEAMSRVPFETYHEGIADMRLRTGLADAFGHASWVLWYPLTSSAARFCWAMSQATGQAQWHTAPMAGAVRDLVTWPQRLCRAQFTTFADVAMIFSEASKSASLWTGCYHGMETFGWGAALADASVQYHNLLEIAVTPELLARYKVVLLPQMTVIDAANAAAIEAYVRAGGTLVVTGETGLLDEQARPRADFRLGELMGVRFADAQPAPFDVVEMDGRRFSFDAERMLYRYGKRLLVVEPRPEASVRTVVTFAKEGREYPGIVEARVGRGRVFTVAGFLGVSNFQAPLDDGEKEIFRRNPDAAAFMGRWVRALLGDGETIAPRALPPGVFYTVWVRRSPRNELAVHLLNVQDYTRREGVVVRRREIRFPRIDGEMALLVRRLGVARASFQAPDLPEPVPCRVESGAEGTTVIIPGGRMTMYGLLKLELTGDAP